MNAISKSGTIYNKMNNTENAVFFLCNRMLFCGCQQITESAPPQNLDDSVQISFKVYFFVCQIFIMTVISLRLSTRWFIFKDYYPLKQRSPLLCNIMIGIITIQSLLYPMLFVFNYFTQTFSETQTGYRVFWHALRGSSYFIYFLRSMRISYAHDIDASRSKTLIFRIFKQQSILASIVVGMIIIRAIPILFACLFQGDNPIYTVVEFNSAFRQKDQIDFLVKTLLQDFAWQIILIYSYWLQFRVNPRYSMRNQLLIIIITNLTLSIIGWGYVNFIDANQTSPFMQLCLDFEFYPIIEIYDIMGLIVMFCVSIIWPLFGKKVYHMLLPTGIHYGLIKTMRDFLMEQQFMQVFSAFLAYHDKQMETRYSQVLDFWKRIMIIKYSCNKSQLEKIQELKQLVESLQDVLFSNHFQLILNLKGSIDGLEKSIINSEYQSQKYKQTINQKLDELEQIALQKLDKIYKEDYQKTKSYYFLKHKIKQYKRINVNMILLNLAIMIETDDQAL